MRGTGLTTSTLYSSLHAPILATLRVHAMASLLVLSALYLLRAVDVSRLFMQTFVVVGGAALLVERVAIRAALTALERREGTAKRRVLVVGSTPVAQRLRRLLRSHPHWGATVAGVVTHVDAPHGSLDVPTLLDTMVFDDVIVSEEVTARHEVQRLARICFERGLTFHTLVAVPTSPRARYRTETLDDGLCLMSVETTPQNIVLLLVKRGIDIVGGLIGLTVCALLFPFLALMIRAGSDGPVFFRQTRVGRNGRQFTLYKFRTMHQDAEAQKAALANQNGMSGCLFKIRNDPRVTRVGRLLRRSYVDELPQFWNVLRGDMSLVGTRPPTPDEVARYAPHHRRRLSMRPGMTGLWQARGNGRITDFEDVVSLDCDYIDRWSLFLDLTIILRTGVTVFRCAGH
jgi:exopolysaccharide biosynthesis polyprenyl glycosylphosphotransferase